MRNLNSAALLAATVFGAGCTGQPGGANPAALPDSESAGAMLLKQRCGQCHGVPAPSVHTADHWPGVLYRMQNRMGQKGVRPLTDDELRTLTDYLRKYAKGAT
jgi:cytochrome c5